MGTGGTACRQSLVRIRSRYRSSGIWGQYRNGRQNACGMAAAGGDNFLPG